MKMQEPVFEFALDLGSAAAGRRRHLHAQLRAAILDGRLKPGASLPSTRAVAAAYGIARNSVIAAYDLLMAEGYVLARPGACAVVAQLAARARPPRRPAAAAAPDDARIAPLWRRPFADAVPAPDLPERSFRLGIPEHRFFPHALWRRLTAQALRQGARLPFRYPPSAGLDVLREAIAQHVAFARAVACTGEDVIVTSGAQQAFDLIARLLVVPGKTRVAVEEPGYPPLRAAFLAAGAVLLPVPVDAEGLCVERLPADVRVVSVTPSHQSPTGVALSQRRRLALLEFARRHGAAILEDDYDGEFRFGARPLDALQTLDRDGRVFYVGTFSKSLFPAIRKGFVVAPEWARAGLAAVKHVVDSHCDALGQAVLAAFIRDGHLARYVRRMRPLYAQRRALLVEALEGTLSPWFLPIPSEAGLHTAARLRDPRRAAAVMAAVRRCTPGAQALQEYAHGRLAWAGVSFGYGSIDADEIRPALRRLRRALDA